MQARADSVSGCAFCGIAGGMRGAHIFYRTPSFVVFKPATGAAGKLLIAPVSHYQALNEMPIAVLAEWLTVAHEMQARVGAASCKMQINVGARLQNVRHLYMQFSYAT